MADNENPCDDCGSCGDAAPELHPEQAEELRADRPSGTIRGGETGDPLPPHSDWLPEAKQPRGYPDQAPPVYREPTEEERRAMNPGTPQKFDRRVRISCPNGNVMETVIQFEDGEWLRNVLRAVISIESPTIKDTDGKVHVYVTQFNNEIGHKVYSHAEALVGDDG